MHRTFTWSTTGTAPDGTAFTQFLHILNNTCASDEILRCTKDADCQGAAHDKCGFAGHRDWRLPSVKELVSIVDYARFQPSIEPVFGMTRPTTVAGPNYWTSTTSAQNPRFAHFVNFDVGSVSTDGKQVTSFGIGLPVRAVRYGGCDW